jgi:hypothetical protein
MKKIIAKGNWTINQVRKGQKPPKVNVKESINNYIIRRSNVMLINLQLLPITNNRMRTPVRIEAMEEIFISFKGFINSLEGSPPSYFTIVKKIIPN